MGIPPAPVCRSFLQRQDFLGTIREVKRHSAECNLSRQPKSSRYRPDLLQTSTHAYQHEESQPTMPPKRITTTDLPKNPDTQPFLDHPATQALDKKSAHAESGGLLPALISLKKRYESVRFKNGDKVTTWSTADIFHLLYSYIINRALAIATIEDDGYILRHSFDSKTDDAFLHFVDALVHAEEGLERSSSRPGKTIVTIDETEKAGRAFKVIRDQPFKFTVRDVGVASNGKHADSFLRYSRKTDRAS